MLTRKNIEIFLRKMHYEKFVLVTILTTMKSNVNDLKMLIMSETFDIIVEG